MSNEDMIISLQKTFDFNDLKHHIVEMSGVVTDPGRIDDNGTREDRAPSLWMLDS